jgi:hypothetical protein
MKTEEFKVNTSNYRYTKGKEYCLDLEEYIGEYHLRGFDAYTGPINLATSKKLAKYHPAVSVLRYNELHPTKTKILTYVEPTKGFVYPDENAYADGVFYRFFVKNRLNPELILEIDLDQAKLYDSENGIDPTIYQFQDLKWNITRTAGKLQYVILENIKNTTIANKKMPGLITQIFSYNEFSEIII